MKKVLLVFLFSALVYMATAQTNNYVMRFKYHNADTMLTQQKLFIWGKTINFPAYLDWKDAPFAIQHTTTGAIGLFTDSTHNFTSGQNLGYIYLKSGSTGTFINDYHKSNIGYFVNNGTAKNVEIVQDANGLMMKAITNISTNHEIVVSFNDIFNLFPADKTLQYLFTK
jgi:hypothetical protein